MFVLVRHAEAGRKKAWRGPDEQRPLTGFGQQQAEGLAANLIMLQAPRLVVSPFLRCRQTLEPLAQRARSQIGADPRLSPGARVSDLDHLLSDTDFDNTVLCTHGEIVEALLRRWQRRKWVTVPIKRSQLRNDATAKAGAWIVTDDEEGWAAHYLQPLHVGPVLVDGDDWPS